MVPWRYGRLGVVLVAAFAAIAAPTGSSAQVVTAPPHQPLPTVPTTTTDPPPATSTTTTTTTTTTAPPPPSTTTTTGSPTTTAGTTTTTGAAGAAATVTTVGPTATTTTTPGARSGLGGGPPPPSLSDSSVSSYLNGLSRNAGPGNSTAALLAALRPLQDFGLTRDQTIAAGFGRFPVGGEAYFRDDFGEPRDTPVPHPHQGNDIFAAFGTPVRSPANGVVNFANEPVGGKCAYVTEPDGTWYYMAHLRGFAPGVAEGSTVRVGDVLGFNGDTGDAQGGAPHVHFEVHPRGGPAVSPKPYLDAWLADALAAVPALMAPYQSDETNPLSAIGLARHLDLGILAGMPRVDDEPLPTQTANELAGALVDPLTPAGLRR